MKLAPADLAKVAPFTSTNRTLGIGNVLSIFGLTAFTLLLCLFLGFGVPRFVAYFEEQELRLPTITQLFILLDRRFVLWQSILTPVLVLVSSITAVVACRLPSHARWLRYLLVGGYMTTALLITLFALVALGLPLAMQKA